MSTEHEIKQLQQEIDREYDDYYGNLARIVCDELADARNRYVRAQERYERARHRAVGLGAIRYDRDKVLGGQRTDIADMIDKLIERHEDMVVARGELESQHDYFVRAMTAAGMDDQWQVMMFQRWQHCRSTYHIANHMTMAAGWSKPQYHGWYFTPVHKTDRETVRYLTESDQAMRRLGAGIRALILTA